MSNIDNLSNASPNETGNSIELLLINLSFIIKNPFPTSSITNPYLKYIFIALILSLSTDK